MKRTLLTAQWEILDACRIVEQYTEVTEHALARIYSGNAVRMIYSGRCKSMQKWSLQITTQASSDDGTIHNHELSFKFDEPMTLRNMVDSVKRMWLDEVDKDLVGLTCIRADAVARCLCLHS